MDPITVPTVGRVIHFFPNNEDATCACNGATKVPAIVVQAWGNLSVNISVFPMNPDATNVLRYSVCHESQANRNDEGEIVTAYWVWPERESIAGAVAEVLSNVVADAQVKP